MSNHSENLEQVYREAFKRYQYLIEAEYPENAFAYLELAYKVAVTIRQWEQGE